MKEAESGVFYSVHISIQPPFVGGSSPYFRATPTFRRPLSWLRPLRPLCKGSHSWQLTKRPDVQEGEKRQCVFLWTIQSVPQLAGHERLVHLFCASQQCTEVSWSKPRPHPKLHYTRSCWETEMVRHIHLSVKRLGTLTPLSCVSVSNRPQEQKPSSPFRRVQFDKSQFCPRVDVDIYGCSPCFSLIDSIAWPQPHGTSGGNKKWILMTVLYMHKMCSKHRINGL